MKIWFERFLAVLRWGWDHFINVSKVIWSKLHAWFSVTVDPPARTRRFYFLCALAVFAMGWISYAFVNSWFYKPTIQALAEFSYVISGDDGDVPLPEIEPLPDVAVAALPHPVKVEEIRCLDMSDTPQCEPVELDPVVVEPEAEPPVVKPKATHRKSRVVRRKPRMTSALEDFTRNLIQ